MENEAKVVLKCDYGKFIEKDELIYLGGIAQSKVVCGKVQLPAYVVHIGSEEVKVKAVYRDVTGKMKNSNLTITSVAAGDPAIKHLRDRGFYVKNEFDAAVYVSKLYSLKPLKDTIIVTSVPGWQKPTENSASLVYVTNATTLGQQQSATKLVLSAQVDAGFKKRGSVEEWNTHVGALCLDNPIPQFMVAIAIAGLLLHYSGLPNCGFHWFGPSKIGKTTGIRIPSSLFGSEDFIRTWNTTTNALEGTAYARNHSLLPLDEIGGGNPKDVADSIYRLMNGLSRSRMGGASQLVDGKRYVGVVLSNGEHDLTTHLKEAGIKIKPGQLVRMCSIPISSPDGVFPVLHGYANAGELGAAITAACNEYYGSVAPAIIEKAVANQEKLKLRVPGMVRQVRDKLMATLPSSEQDGVHDAVAKSFAMAQVAGVLAIKWKVIDWPLDSVIKAVNYCFSSWADQHRRTTTVSEAEILKHFAQFFQSHSSSKFVPYDQFESAKNGVLAGYTHKVDGVPVFMIFPAYFDVTLSEKYGRDAGISALRESGYLISGSRSTPTRQATIPKHARGDGPEKMSFIVIKASILRHDT